MTKSLFSSLALTLACSAAFAQDTCEPLRARIEANIASKGVTGFIVTVVDADASAAGDVVGSCGNGTKKLVYARNASAGQAKSAPAPALAPAPVARKAPVNRTPDTQILTECKDGTVSMGGTCKP